MADELAANVLKYLSENKPIDTQDLAKILCVDHQKIVGVVKSLQASGDVRYFYFESISLQELTQVMIHNCIRNFKHCQRKKY